MTLSFQSDQHLSTGHVLGSAIGLEPVPFLAEYFGDLGASAMPIFINNGLNERQIGFGNGSFSNGYRQHDEHISEEERGRQQKMQGMQKYFSRQFEIKDVGRNGNDLPIRWVEMKKGGLEMPLKSRRKRY